MIKARENELNNYLPKENTKQLKIGENINLEKNTIEPIKKMKNVKFDMDIEENIENEVLESGKNNIMDGFMSKLKDKVIEKDETEKDAEKIALKIDNIIDELNS